MVFVNNSNKYKRKGFFKMTKIRFEYQNALSIVSEHEIENLKPQIYQAHKTLTEKTGAGNEFLGWIDLPVNYDKEEFERIKKAA